LTLNSLKSGNYQNETQAIKCRPDGQLLQYILENTANSKKSLPRTKKEKQMQMESERINLMNENSRNVTSYNLSQKNRNNQFDVGRKGYNFMDY
jgi:hypothetical protein